MTWARFLSLARSKLRLCSANRRPGYLSNLSYDWPSIAWDYSEQETENGPLACDWLSIVWAYSEQETETGPGVENGQSRNHTNTCMRVKYFDNPCCITGHPCYSSEGKSMSCRLQSPATWLLGQFSVQANDNEHINISHYPPIVGGRGFTRDWWFSHQTDVRVDPYMYCFNKLSLPRITTWHLGDLFLGLCRCAT